MRFFIALGVVVFLCGCSASHWVGESTRQPGVVARIGAWGSKEIRMTSDGTASVDSVLLATSQPTRGQKDFTLEIKKLAIDQRPSEVVSVEGQKILAIAEAQRVQVEYVTAMWTGISDVVRELIPVLSLLASANISGTSTMGWTLELPGDITIGREKITQAADLQRILETVLFRAERASLAPTTQPSK